VTVAYTGIPRRAKATITVMSNILDGWITLCNLLGYVGRRVIDDNDLIVGIGLRQYAFDGLMKKMGLLETWNDNADIGFFSHVERFCRCHG